MNFRLTYPVFLRNNITDSLVILGQWLTNSYNATTEGKMVIIIITIIITAIVVVTIQIIITTIIHPRWYVYKA